MTGFRNDPDTEGPPTLAACFRRLVWARAQLEEARTSRPGRDLRGPRGNLLWALETYEAALADIGAPVPPRLHSEIQMYRHLGGHQ